MSAWTKKELENMLEDVVNELDLSDGILDEHGPLGTSPAQLVRLVLDRKDLEIAMLRRRFIDAARPLEVVMPSPTEVKDTRLRAKLTQAQAAVSDLYAELKAVEWVEEEEGVGVFFCPRCLKYKERGHTMNCPLNAALKKARGEE